MYIPPHFNEDRIEVLHDAIRNAGLATLATMTPDGMIASHLPLLLDPDRGPHGTLVGHLARANPQTKTTDTAVQAMVVFHGPDGYVSPSLYATKKLTDKVVPTWNYVAIHAYGTIEFFDDADRLLQVVTRLTEQHEAPRAEPWAVSDAPAEFVRTMLRAIVGVSIPIDRLEGKYKLSQNRPPADHAGIVSGLEAEGNAGLAAQVARALADKA
ncbi:MAG: FMN-binding negative transcriptional regulator [Rhodospirillales bacterium]